MNKIVLATKLPMKLLELIEWVFAWVSKSLPNQITSKTWIHQLVMNELDERFAYALTQEDMEQRKVFQWIDFWENYVRLKIGQEEYDATLKSVYADIVSQAILEWAESNL